MAKETKPPKVEKPNIKDLIPPPPSPDITKDISSEVKKIKIML